MRIRARWEHYGLRLALRVHDELVYSCPKGIAERVYESVLTELNRPPAWMPDVPLASEGGIADRWGDVKH